MTRFRNTLILMLAAQIASAQGGEPLRRAERYYASGDLYNAAIQYEQYLGFRKTKGGGYAPYTPQKTGAAPKAGATERSAAMTRLADCYHGLNDHEKAVEYYRQAASMPAASRLRYAASLRALGRRDESAALLQSLGQEGTLSAEERAQVAQELASVRFQPQADALLTVSKTPGDANTGHGNYAAVQSGSVLFFTSSRSDTSVKTEGPNRNHLYRIVGSEALKADIIEKSDIDQGLCSFTPDGRRVYFTAWIRKGDRKEAGIYTTVRQDGGWAPPQPLNAEVNAPGASNAQPCVVVKDGRSYLLFSSDRAGGQGGYDIWYAPVDESGNAGHAQNLGSTVNTALDEAAPFYHLPTGTFVFASRGHAGMGGYDLFYGDGPFLQWNSVRNAGQPLNSVKDDSYFFSASKDSLLREAWISSDRASDCCLELFSVSRAEPPKPPPPPPAPPVPDTAQAPPPPPVTYELPVILFDFDKWELTGEAMGQLDEVTTQMKNDTTWKLRIGGYTDGKGGERYNDRLSDRRARAVRDYLYKKGIESKRLWIKGFGECCPVEAEQQNGQDNPEARKKNRRVTLQREP